LAILFKHPLRKYLTFLSNYGVAELQDDIAKSALTLTLALSQKEREHEF